MPIGGISEPTVNFCQFGPGNLRQLGSDFVGRLPLPVSITRASPKKAKIGELPRLDGYITDNS